MRALVRSAVSGIALAGALAGLGASMSWGAEPDVLARVNGQPVTRADVQRVLADSAVRRQLEEESGVQPPDSKVVERLAVRRLITRQLILQEARRRDFTVPERDIDAALTDLRARFADLKAFGMWMHERGLDDKSLFDALRTDMLMKRVMAALVEKVRPTDAQIAEYYEAHNDDLKTAGDVRLRVIAVKDEAAAREIVTLLQRGESFQQLARERSLGVRAAKGGDTGWVAVETLPAPVRQAVATLKVGEASGPLRRESEFLIVGLAARRPGREKTLREARTEIEQRLLPAMQQRALQAWLAEQETRSTIEVFDHESK